jgi:signal transduction histidine kinase
MERKLAALSARYLAALRKHLRQSSQASLALARALGLRAVAIGLETLDVARIHEQALATLAASGRKGEMVGRANIFFTETIAPIEETHDAALLAGTRLSQLNKALGRRTVDLVAANRSLQQGITRRKTAEAALKKGAAHYGRLLEESRALQKHLQHLAHQILSAQENKRKKISQELQDEIAQTLLGINVRLLTVKKAANRSAQGLQQEVASTQRLVERSVKTMNRFARAHGNDHAS